MPFKFFNKELSHVVGREPLTKREEASGPEHLPSALGQHPKERGKKEKKGKLRDSVSEGWVDPTSWQLAGTALVGNSYQVVFLKNDSWGV